MKIGDVITAMGPRGPAGGTVIDVEAMKTRAGWYVTIDRRDMRDPNRYILREEDEGRTWCYGEAESAVKALESANALMKRPHGRWSKKGTP